MVIVIQPTMIKDSFYLLIPKNIADLIEIKDKTKFSLKIKNNRSKQILEYHMG